MTVLGRELSASSNKCFHLQSKKCCCCCYSLFSFISVYSEENLFFFQKILFFSVDVVRSILLSLITFCIKSRICLPYFISAYFFPCLCLSNFRCRGLKEIVEHFYFLETEDTFAIAFGELFDDAIFFS